MVLFETEQTKSKAVDSGERVVGEIDPFEVRHENESSFADVGEAVVGKVEPDEVLDARPIESYRGVEVGRHGGELVAGEVQPLEAGEDADLVKQLALFRPRIAEAVGGQIETSGRLGLRRQEGVEASLGARQAAAAANGDLRESVTERDNRTDLHCTYFVKSEKAGDGKQQSASGFRSVLVADREASEVVVGWRGVGRREHVGEVVVGAAADGPGVGLPAPGLFGQVAEQDRRRQGEEPQPLLPRRTSVG